jgi:hypothetical protein
MIHMFGCTSTNYTGSFKLMQLLTSDPLIVVGTVKATGADAAENSPLADVG